MDHVLYDAVIKDNIDVLKETDFNGHLTPTKNNVLHLACQHGSMKCLQHILCVDESLLLMMNSRGETGLHLAARQGHYQVVIALFDIAAKALPPKPKRFKNTSLNVKQVLIRTLNKERETALHVSVRYNHNNVVQLLVTEDPSHSYPRNKYGETPLYLASFGCYSDIVRTILDYSESPTFGGPYGSTALHAALLNDGGHECVKLLLEKNKDLIKVATELGWTAFHQVALCNSYTIVEDLVGANKSVGYLKEYNNNMAIHVAAIVGNVNVMKKLLEYYPDCWEIVDGRGENILHMAVRNDQKEVIRFILSQGCKAISNLLTQRNKKGDTPLHLIAKLGCYVEELIELRTVDWMVPNSEGLTPLEVLNTGLHTSDLADQAKIKKLLVNAKVKKGKIFQWQLKKHPLESTEVSAVDKAVAKKIDKMINTHIIVAALITTVALTAGFSMPGGFDEKEGSPVLLRNTAFKLFVIADAAALLLSVSSLSLYFYMIMFKGDIEFCANLFMISSMLNYNSIVAMLLAFITGTYAVLAHSSFLAIFVCVVLSLFAYFILSLFTLYRIWAGVSLRDDPCTVII